MGDRIDSFIPALSLSSCVYTNCGGIPNCGGNFSVSLTLPLLLVRLIKMSGFARYANNVFVVADAVKVETTKLSNPATKTT